MINGVNFRGHPNILSGDNAEQQFVLFDNRTKPRSVFPLCRTMCDVPVAIELPRSDLPSADSSIYLVQQLLRTASKSLYGHRISIASIFPWTHFVSVGLSVNYYRRL